MSTRETQEYIEAIIKPLTTKVRDTQEYIEVLHCPNTAQARHTQEYIEILVSIDYTYGPRLQIMN